MPSCYVQIWRTGISTDTFRATEMCARKADGLVKGPFLSFALWKFKLTEFQSVVFWKSWVFKKTGLAETSGSYRISGSVNPCYESLPFSEIRSRFARFEQAETQKRMTVPLPSNPACKPLKKVCCGDDNFRISLETIFLENIQKNSFSKKKSAKWVKTSTRHGKRPPYHMPFYSIPKKRVEKNRYIGLDPGDDAMRGWGFNSPGRGWGTPLRKGDVLGWNFLLAQKRETFFSKCIGGCPNEQKSSLTFHFQEHHPKTSQHVSPMWKNLFGHKGCEFSSMMNSLLHRGNRHDW